jgi:hypothetical protein
MTTVEDEWCKHDMLAVTCSTCLHGPEVRSSRRRYVPVDDAPSFPARFAGQCPACNLPIAVGRPIVKTTLGLYVHAPECLDG